MPFSLEKRYFSCTTTVAEGGIWHFHREEGKSKGGEDVKWKYGRIKQLEVITACFISQISTPTLLIFAADKKEVLA